MTQPVLPHVTHCFGCGANNPLGLNVDFTYHDHHVNGTFQSTDNHMGPPGIVHGGVIAAIIDESFSILCRGLLKKEARTIKEEISFRKPARTGAVLTVSTKMDKETTRVIMVSAEVYSENVLIAQGWGTMFKMK